MTIRVWLFGFLAASPLAAQGTQAIQVRDGDLLGPVAHAVDPALRESPALVQQRHVATGTVTVSFVVGPDGRAEPNSADALRAEPAVLTRYASRLAESCRFTPGRVRGEPVRVRLVQTFRLYRG